MSDEERAERLFDVPAEIVREATACTWCGADVGVHCVEGNRLGERRSALRLHAQRWRDYWNATHDRADQTPVHEAPWRDYPPGSSRSDGDQ